MQRFTLDSILRSDTRFGQSCQRLFRTTRCRLPMLVTLLACCGAPDAIAQCVNSSPPLRDPDQNLAWGNSYGNSVAAQHNVANEALLFVGDPSHHVPASGNRRGAVSRYIATPSGWTLEGSWISALDDSFGSSVAVAANVSFGTGCGFGFHQPYDYNVVAIGASPGPDAAGSLYIGTRTTCGGSVSASLLGPFGSGLLGPSQTDGFASSVAISGTYIIAGVPGYDIDVNGAPSNNCGEAVIYDSNGNWLAQLGGSLPPLAPNSRFGSSVAIDGSYAMVTSNAGVHVFQMNGPGGTTWNYLGLVAPPPANEAFTKVWMSGGNAYIGSICTGLNCGIGEYFMVREYQNTGTMFTLLPGGLNTSGSAFAISDDLAVTVATGTGFHCHSRNVFAYRRTAGTWSLDHTMPWSPTFVTGGSAAADSLTNTVAVGSTNGTVCSPINPGPPSVGIAFASSGNTSNVIAQQPAPATGCAGNSASFAVQTNGTGLTYQWRRNGINIPTNARFVGLNAATLTINQLVSADAGSYDCVISTPCGPIATSPVPLTVNVAPSLGAASPSTPAPCLGTNITLSVPAPAGTPAPTLQWYRAPNTPITNNATFSGATTASLTITNVSFSTSGDYFCRATNSCGSTDSTASTVTISTAPSLGNASPAVAAACPGTLATLTVTVAPTNPAPTLQWYRAPNTPITNGNGFAGATTNALTITASGSTPAGNYFCRATSTCGTFDSAPAAFSVSSAPILAAASPSVAAPCDGSQITLSAPLLSGAPAPTYQWYRAPNTPIANGGGFAGATTNSLTITASASTPAGNYYCRASNSCGTFDSSPSAFSVSTPPSVPTAFGGTFNQGQTAVLSAAATGSALTFTWYYGTTLIVDGAGLNGETFVGQGTSTLQIQSAQPANTGSYHVVVSGSCSPPQTSNTVNLTIVPVCPTGPGGPIVTYQLIGSPSNVIWDWRMNSTNPLSPFQNTGIQNAGPVPTTGTLADLADEFARSINNYFVTSGCTSAQANAYSSGNMFGRFLNVQMAAGTTYQFDVRTNSTFPWCQMLPGFPCSFNPTMERLELPGADCNGNGIDDLIDIAAATSIDANGNSIPDECEFPCTLRITSRPLHRSLTEGQTTTFTVAAESTDAVSYQWLKDGQPILDGSTGNNSIYSGTGTPTLTITNIRLADVGRYSANIFNTCGNLTTPYGHLFVNIDPCPADFNHDGTVDFFDYLDFVDAFSAGISTADFNHDLVIDFFDYLDFVDAFSAGC